MTEEARLYTEPGTVNFTAAAALVSGQVLQLSDGRSGVVAGLAGFASGDLAAAHDEGIFDFASASATTFSVGDEVWWDASANQAVKKSLTLDGDNDFYLGICVRAKTSGQTVVRAALNVRANGLDPIVFEFDCEGGDTDPHMLVPPEQNRNGLLITGVYGIVTEVFGGGDEDQGVVTVKDTAGTPNTITTVTVADAGADAIGDVRLGYKIDSATAGDAAKIVAAGLGVTGAVTTQTAGASAAGKIKVYVTAIPLL